MVSSDHIEDNNEDCTILFKTNIKWIKLMYIYNVCINEDAH